MHGACPCRQVAATLGFRYEIEGAAFLARVGKQVESIGMRISVPWKPGELGRLTGRTDIDVEVFENGNRIFYQLKRTPGALHSLREVQAWAEKARRQLEIILNTSLITFDGVRFAIPGGKASIGNQEILNWINKVGIQVDDIPSQ